MINQQGETWDINLDFLEADQEYGIAYYEGAKETNCKTKSETYQVLQSTLIKGDIINAVLAPDGGHCMWIKLAGK